MAPMPSTPLYRLGDQGPAVAQIRELLAGLGLLPTHQDADDAFDASVDHAVRRFQQDQGITVDGIVGRQTYRRLDEAHWRLGDRLLHHQARRMLRGDDVAELQQRLADMGFASGRVDGIFGTLTENAVRRFQRNVGLPVDGRCGPATFAALGRLTRTVTGGMPVALREHEAIHAGGPALSGKVIVVDAGHGGPDTGYVSPHVDGLTEAAMSADIASRIEGRLTALGAMAFLTHGADLPEILDEEARADFANAARADLVVSVHAESCTSPLAHGVATYYFGAWRSGAHSSVGERLADLLQEEVVARTDLLDGRTHRKTWDLLRHTTMPAVRLEVGYLSNPGDAARLADAGFRDVVAEAVVTALQRLFTPSPSE
jgi:N-acetylmuramoyl-L-alanine amidase